MALDYMAIASCGMYPTPSPTATRRAGLAVSYGLANFTLPAAVIPTTSDSMVLFRTVEVKAVELTAVELAEIIEFI